MSNLFEIKNPYNNTSLGSFAYDDQASMDYKMGELKKGIKISKAIPAFKKAEILHKAAQILLDRKDKIAKTITMEMGKTITDSFVEVERSASTCQCAGDEARKISGEVLNSDSYAPQRNKIARIIPKGFF